MEKERITSVSSLIQARILMCGQVCACASVQGPAGEMASALTPSVRRGRQHSSGAHPEDKEARVSQEGSDPS